MIPGITAGAPIADASAVAGLLEVAFTERTTTLYRAIQPAALVFNDEPFNADLGQFTQLSEATPGAFALSDGKCVITHVAPDKNNVVLAGPDIGQPQVFVSIDVVSQSGAAGGYDNIGVGVAKDANNFIYAGYDRVNKDARIQIKLGGSNNFHAGTYANLVAPYRLALSIVGNFASLWVDNGSGWDVLTYYDLSGRINFKTADLTGWKGSFTVATPGNSTWTFDNWKIGRFGAVGLRDMTLVTHEDGAPYVEAGKVYFTATAAEGHDSYNGIFTLDLATDAIEQTAVIQVKRGGVIHNDVAAHVIRYGPTDYRIVISTWGNGFGGALAILHKQVSGVDLLHGSHVLEGMTDLAPPGSAGVYDPMLVRIGGLWHLAYTTTTNLSFSGHPFYAALATSPDLATWTLVGKDDANNGYEATKIIKDGNSYHVVASGPAGVGTGSRVFDLTMAYQGALDAYFYGGTDTQPHPMAFTVGSTWYLLTYDNHRFNGLGFTWGRPMVYIG